MTDRYSRENLRKAIEVQLAKSVDTLPSLDEDWMSAGLDSLEVSSVCIQLEDSIGREIPIEDFAEEMTTSNLLDFLEQQFAKTEGE
jgi:acyl carrier protein